MSRSSNTSRFVCVAAVLLSIIGLTCGCRGRHVGGTDGPRPTLARRVEIHNLRASPDYRYVGFDLTEPERPRTVHVIGLSDGKLVRRVSSRAYADMVGWSPDAQNVYCLRLFADDEARKRDGLYEIDIASGEERRLPVETYSMTSPRGILTWVSAVASHDLKVFVISARTDDGPALYVVPFSGGRPELLARGERLVAGGRAMSSGRTALLLVTTESSATSSTGSRLVLRRYPGSEPVSLPMPAGIGRPGIGCVIRNGRYAVIPYPDSEPEHGGSRAYIVDAAEAKIAADTYLPERVHAAVRLGQPETFLLYGAQSLWVARFDADSARITTEKVSLPAELSGKLTSVAPVQDMEIVLASDGKIWTLNLETGRHWILWPR